MSSTDLIQKKLQTKVADNRASPLRYTPLLGSATPLSLRSFRPAKGGGSTLGALHKSQSATHISNWRNQKRDRPRFQTARFPEFWQSAIPANEGKKNAKTLGSCKPNAHWCANLKARARDRPHNFFYFPSLFKDE